MIAGVIGALATVAGVGVAVQAVTASDEGASGGSGGTIQPLNAEQAVMQTLGQLAATPGPCASIALELIQLNERYTEERSQGKRGNKWLRKLGRAADRMAYCMTGIDLRRFSFRDVDKFAQTLVNAVADGYVATVGGEVKRDEGARS